MLFPLAVFRAFAGWKQSSAQGSLVGFCTFATATSVVVLVLLSLGLSSLAIHLCFLSAGDTPLLGKMQDVWDRNSLGRTTPGAKRRSDQDRRGQKPGMMFTWDGRW